MARNHVPADDGLVTEAFLKIGSLLSGMRTAIAELQSRPVGGGSGGGVTVTDNGDGTATLTIAEGSTTTLTDNGDGTATLTL